MSQATFPFASGPAFVHFWKPQPVIQGRGQSLTSEHQPSRVSTASEGGSRPMVAASDFHSPFTY